MIKKQKIIGNLLTDIIEKDLLPVIFPCSGCGACCHRINKAIDSLGEEAFNKNSELYFPYNWDNNGRCEMLTDDNKCSVYKDRPLICNIDKFLLLIDIPKKQFYDINISACNAMMDEDNIPLTFRIN